MSKSTTLIDTALLPIEPGTGEPLLPRQQPGYYPKFSTLSQSPFWEEATRDVVEKRVNEPPARKWFSEDAWTFWKTVFEHLIPQADRTADRQVPLLPMLDERLAQNKTVGYRYTDMPHDRVVYELGIHAIDQTAEHMYRGKFMVLAFWQQDRVLQSIAKSEKDGAENIWEQMSITRFWQMIMVDAIDAYYAHPWAWDEIGFGGPAYPRAYIRLERGEPEPWEVREKRYEWAPPTGAVSGQNITPSDDSQSHHGSGGTH